MYAKPPVYKRKRSIRAPILLAGATVGITACSPNAPPGKKSEPIALSGASAQHAQQSEQYRLTATVQDLMDGIIDPSADVLWDSVAYIATTKGIEDRQPRTDDEWKKVRYGAITLIEGANLLSMPGRRVAGDPADGTPPAKGASVGTGELTHAEIQQRIDSSHAAFVQFARNLQDAGLKALAAIKAKDATALMDAGGRIDEACEACHVTYWYPNQNRPGN